MSGKLPRCDICRDNPGQPRDLYSELDNLATWVKHLCVHCARGVRWRAARHNGRLKLQVTEAEAHR